MTTASANGQPVTMRDVADAAGVSVATVSLVVNKKKSARIGDATRARVNHAIKTLGYRPNALAKNLVSGQSKFIGLVADAIATTPFAGQIIHGAQDEAWKHGFVLLVANTEGNDDAEREAITMMLEYQVRGVIYSTWYHRAVEVPAPLKETDFILVNCYETSRTQRAVVPNEFQGGYAATRIAIERGHRRIAFINTLTHSPARDGRLAGYRAALSEARITSHGEIVIDSTPEQEGGYAATREVLRSGATAVFCHNDRVAMGLYDGLRRRGVDIPGDVAVVGFDNQEVIAAHLRPPLTTVQLPHYELGATGVRRLLGVSQSVDNTPAVTEIDCPPVIRQST